MLELMLPALVASLILVGVHAYLGIDDDTIWSIIQDDIPDLLLALKT